MNRHTTLDDQICAPPRRVIATVFTLLCTLTLVACGDIGDVRSTDGQEVQTRATTVLAASFEPSKTADLLDLDAEVDRFDAAMGGFASVALRDTGPNTEFFFGTAFYRVDEHGVVFRVPTIDRVAFEEAHKPYQRESWRFPSRHDVAWVPTDNDEVPAGHHRVADLPAGTRFVFQHKFFFIEEESTGRSVVETGDVLRPVLSTSDTDAKILVDLVVTRGADLEETLTGTPDHAFWIPALRDYRPLGDLQPGTVLRTDGGQEVTVVRNSRRYGQFPVHNLIVEGQHNYFVSADGLDTAGVLAHNGKDCNGNKNAQADAGSCFVAGTQVLTAEGSADIESIEVGTLVVARDVAQDQLGPDLVCEWIEDDRKPSAQRVALETLSEPRLDARPRFQLPTPVSEASPKEALNHQVEEQHNLQNHLENRTSKSDRTKEAGHE